MQRCRYPEIEFETNSLYKHVKTTENCWCFDKCQKSCLFPVLLPGESRTCLLTCAAHVLKPLGSCKHNNLPQQATADECCECCIPGTLLT